VTDVTRLEREPLAIAPSCTLCLPSPCSPHPAPANLSQVFRWPHTLVFLLAALLQ
jgi:hypothetical protein